MRPAQIFKLIPTPFPIPRRGGAWPDEPTRAGTKNCNAETKSCIADFQMSRKSAAGKKLQCRNKSCSAKKSAAERSCGGRAACLALAWRTACGLQEACLLRKAHKTAAVPGPLRSGGLLQGHKKKVHPGSASPGSVFPRTVSTVNFQ